ncbi:MAG: hypothetical protein GTO03_08285 [Planctomycetales bacterium]|nr:hypothetical protein [Planctomycetales bacterium]
MATARRVVEIGVLAAATLLVLRTWFVEGLLVPVRVAGPSMAETFRGPHRQVNCHDCGFSFAVAEDQWPAQRAVVCPHCRAAMADLDPWPRYPGDRLLIDKLAFAWRPPRRWEAVVFRCPHQASRYCVKRIVGLPGERVQIAGGEVLVQGRLSPKSIWQFRQLAQLVHDNRFRHRPTKDRPPVWQSVAGGGWQSQGDGFRCLPRVSAADREQPLAVDWLWFQHPAQPAPRAPLSRPLLVTDDYGYNQSLSRSLNPVNDLLLVTRLVTSGPGELCLRGVTADHQFLVRLQPAAGSGQLYVDGRLVAQWPGGRPFFRQPQQLEWALVDGTCQLAIAGQRIFRHVLAKSALGGESVGGVTAGGGEVSGPSAPWTVWPLALGAAGVEVQLANLQVYRDVYYTKVAGDRGDQEEGILLGDQQYFVLGDNSPRSQDSRQGSGGSPVHRDFLVGPARRGR